MKFRLSSEYNVLEEVRDGRVHHGIDLAMPEGTELRSIAEGVVERVVDYGSQNIGKGVVVELEDGTRAIYGHMSNVDVEVGDKLDAGELLGLSGNTGHSTGPHLHFGLKNEEGEWLDPTPIADELASISGELKENIPWWDFEGKVRAAIESQIEATKEHAKETVKEWIIGGLEAVGELLEDAIYSISLVGTGVLILLKVAGWNDAGRYASVLFVIYVLIKYLFGGM